MTILVLRQKAIDNLNDIWNYIYENVLLMILFAWFIPLSIYFKKFIFFTFEENSSPPTKQPKIK